MYDDPYVPLPSEPVQYRRPSGPFPDGLPFTLQDVLGVALLLLFLVLAFLLARFAIRVRNEIVKLHQACEQRQNTLEYLVGRRRQLIQQIYDIAKAFAGHERGLHLDVLDRLAKAMQQNAANASVIIADLRSALPGIASAPNFSQVQSDIARLDNEITNALAWLNGDIKTYNVFVSHFPNNMVAAVFGYGKKPYRKRA